MTDRSPHLTRILTAHDVATWVQDQARRIDELGAALRQAQTELSGAKMIAADRQAVIDRLLGDLATSEAAVSRLEEELVSTQAELARIQEDPRLYDSANDGNLDARMEAERD